MGRVNVETRALAESRLRDLMKAMRWRKSQAIGTLVLLWHDSQERLVVYATKKQMVSWTDAKTEVEGEKIIKALIESEYISPEPDGTFFIKGNDKHVEAHRVWKDAQRKGGRASGESRKNKELSEVPLQKIEVPTEVNAIQYNSSQLNPSQSNSTQDNPIQNIKAERPDGPPTRAASSPRGPIDEFKGDELVEQYLNEVTKDTQKAWLKVYPGAQWIVEEVKKAHIWMTTNPQKKSKNFARFMSNWLSRAFESYRKGLPSRRLTHSEQNAQAAMDLYKRNEEGNL